MSNLTSPSVAWVVLLVAGAFEIVWALSRNASEGFTKATPTSVTIIAAIASFGLLGLALKVLPVGTAYAVWTGIGAAGVAIFGIIYFHDAASLSRLICIALIVVGVVGLRIGATSQ